ncbi:hypothetical protein ABFS83_14G241800 [Erythranthe nasuta]
MSTTIICIAFVHISFLLCCTDEAMGRHYPVLPSAPSTALPKAAAAADYVTVNPGLKPHKQRVFHRREVNNCMPKGFHRSSAPSRYVNYQTLGSFRCSSDTHSRKH